MPQRYEYITAFVPLNESTVNAILNDRAEKGWSYMHACPNEGQGTVILFFRKETERWLRYNGL